MTVLLRAAKFTRRHAARLQDQMTEHHVIADWHLDKRVPIALIFAIARTWIGTPYHHQASKKGRGADCLGLVRGVWRELYGAEPEVPPPYSADWAEATREETLLAAARRNLVEIPKAEAEPGDVVLFRMVPGGPAKHAGILSGDGRFIHAYSGKAVSNSVLSPWWEKKIIAAFTWPEGD